MLAPSLKCLGELVGLPLKTAGAYGEYAAACLDIHLLGMLLFGMLFLGTLLLVPVNFITPGLWSAFFFSSRPLGLVGGRRWRGVDWSPGHASETAAFSSIASWRNDHRFHLDVALSEDRLGECWAKLLALAGGPTESFWS